MQEVSVLETLYSTTFPCGSAGKESPCNVGDLGLIPGLGRSPGEGNGCPLQYSSLGNSNNYIVHGVAKSQTGLIYFYFHVRVYRKKHNILRFLSFNPGTHSGVLKHFPHRQGETTVFRFLIHFLKGKCLFCLSTYFPFPLLSFLRVSQISIWHYSTSS